jgi:hypothetical protein
MYSVGHDVPRFCPRDMHAGNAESNRSLPAQGATADYSERASLIGLECGVGFQDSTDAVADYQEPRHPTLRICTSPSADDMVHYATLE